MQIVRESLSGVVAACLAMAIVPDAHGSEASEVSVSATAASGRAYFRANDFENAARSLQLEASVAEKAGAAPPEESLQMLAECFARLSDVTGQAWALEKLVTHYPKPKYWSDLISLNQRRKDFGERLALDVLRLRRETGTLQGPGDYVELAGLAMRAGYPAEASAALEQGFARGVLGVGSDAARQRALHADALRQAADQRSTLDRMGVAYATGASGSGEALVHLGYVYVTYGDHARGLSLMQAGLRKGGLERPEDATMRLGIAYVQAGRKAEALQTLSAVTGMHGAADLGHLWYLYALGNAM